MINKFDYSRAGNPTVDAFEQCLAALEHAKYGISFSSGCGAMTSLFSILKSGDRVLVGDDVYGGTNRLLNKNFVKFGIKVDMVDFATETWTEKLSEDVKIVFLETPTNPTLKVFDIEAIAAQLKGHPSVLVVDNTFATPYLQSPLLLGADAVLHSCTKYIGGHSDVLAGALLTNDKDLHDRVRFNLLSLGPCLSAFDGYILLRSVKTLKVRMKEACRNARAIVEYLDSHPNVERVTYPGLKSHPQHEIACRIMRDFGAMITIYMKGDIKQTRQFLESLKLFTIAESLGAVESLIECPALMTHMSVPPEQRKLLGIHDTQVRLSVGIEDAEDLLADLEQALGKMVFEKQ